MSRGLRSSLVGLALATLSLVACSAPGGATQPLGAERLPIFGGAPAPDDTAVVAIVNFSGGDCSGSLIAPNLVLTARHCVADTTEKDVKVLCGQTPFKAPDSAGAMFVVPLPTISMNPDDYLAVAEIRMLAGQDADLCGTDVALLRLKQPLADVTPLVPRVTKPVLKDEPYSAVGYGIDESLPDMPSSVRKRLDDLQVVCNDAACRGSDVRDNEWVGSGGPCPGDSGGPALDAKGRVIGVVSRGKSGCTEPVYSDVATRADWLQSEAISAARAAGQQPPAWACDATHSCDEPQTGEPKATCAFAPPAPGGASRGGWLLALLLLWRRRHSAVQPRITRERGAMSIRPKRAS